MYKNKIHAFIILFFLLYFIFSMNFKINADTGGIGGAGGTGRTFTISKSVAPSTVSPNALITYSITIRNNSSTNAAAISLEDTLPEGFSFNNISRLTTVEGRQIDFTPTVTGNRLIWRFEGSNVQSIPPNQSIVITYQVRTGQSTGTFNNRACLTQPENICAVASVIVTINPNASISPNIILALLIGIPLLIFGISVYRGTTFEKRVLK